MARALVQGPDDARRRAGVLRGSSTRVRYDRTIIAYHGCGKTTADRILAGEPFEASDNDYDWLGSGIYFWEFGHDRALKWAEFQVTRNKFRKPAVVGAVIQLGNCFDLLDTGSTAKLSGAYAAFLKSLPEGTVTPTNSGGAPDRKFRRLDCAVLNFYLKALEEARHGYDSVRGAFIEGDAAFDGSDIKKDNHIQIAVRNPACVLGVFRP
ncbi:MAG TPA: hypothetical protein VGL81_23540 [Polyangiaceae bacterium]